MNGNKKINFYYYKPCLKSDPAVTVSLAEYFKRISSIEDSKTFNVDIPSDVTISKIERHEKFDIADGPIAFYPTWELLLNKSRLDVPAMINVDTHMIKPVPIQDDERITNSTTVMYDEKTHIVIVQSGIGCISISQVQDLLNEYVSEEDKIGFLPLYYKDSITRIENYSSNRSISARIICPASNRDELMQNNKDATIEHLIAASNNLQQSSEVNLTMEVVFKVDDREKSVGFGKISYLSMIQNFLYLHAKGLVNKIVASGYLPESKKKETIDLLNGRIKDTHSFIVTTENRYLTPESIYNGILVEYNRRRKNFL